MIFNLFKSKPTLKEIIPQGFIDIHSHVLPAIDDGAKDVKESIKLIDKMKEMGFSKIIATPHTYPGLYENDTESIGNAFEEVNSFVNKNINIGYASEYMICESLIKKAQEKQLLCLKDNFVLIEMSYISEPIGLFEIIYEIRVNDYIPILAHPERYLFIDDSKKYFKLKRFGCLFQANLLSTVDYYGTNIRKNLEKLISYGLIDFVGSDIHNERHISAFDKEVRIKNIKDLEDLIQKNNQFS